MEGFKEEIIAPLIFRHAVEGILVTDRYGKIVLANPSCLALFGYAQDAMVGQKVEMLMPQGLRERHVGHRQAFTQKPEKRQKASGIRMQGLTREGIEMPLEISLSFFENEKGLFVICFIVDVTERERLTQKMERKKLLLSQYLEVTDAVFLVLDKNACIDLINPKGCELLGLTAEEAQGKNWFDHFVPEDERTSVRKVFEGVLDGSLEGSAFYENHIVDAKGSRRLMEWQNTVLLDEEGLPKATLSSGIDITEKRAAENARKWALVEGQEEERRRIARDLHDGLGQSISAISLNLNSLEPELEKFNKQFNHIYDRLRGQLTDTIEDVRSITHNLMPRILEDYGLEKALEHLCDTLDQSTEVKVSLDAIEGLQPMAPNQQMGIYRIVQELVNNALKHAQADHIDVQLSQLEGKMTILVEDDGNGFDPKRPSDGLGFPNVRTRLELLNGQMFIDTDSRQGTSITIEIPL